MAKPASKRGKSQPRPELAGLATRLRTARTRAGLSQIDLARQIGMGQSTLSMFEKGQNEPSFQELRRIALATGVDPGWLTYGSRGLSDAGAQFEAAPEPSPTDPHGDAEAMSSAQALFAKLSEAVEGMLQEIGLRLRPGARSAIVWHIWHAHYDTQPDDDSRWQAMESAVEERRKILTASIAAGVLHGNNMKRVD